MDFVHSRSACKRAAAVVCALLAASIPPCPAANATASLDEAWVLAENNLASDAYRMFRALKDHPGIDERERAFGEASTLLNLQPRTTENVRLAEALFESISSENDLKGLLSKFFLAKILSDYVSPPRYSEALTACKELVALRSGNPVVENTASRIVALTETSFSKRSERLAALRALEPLAESLSSKPGRRDFFLTLGFAYLSADDAKDGLRVLLAADAEGITRPQAERNACY